MNKNILIMFDGKKISYDELFTLFFNKDEDQTLVIEDVHPFNMIHVKLIRRER